MHRLLQRARRAARFAREKDRQVPASLVAPHLKGMGTVSSKKPSPSMRPNRRSRSQSEGERNAASAKSSDFLTS